MAGGFESERGVQIDDRGAGLHLAGDEQRIAFTALAEDFFEDLVNRDDRDDEVFRILKGVLEMDGLCGIGQIFESGSGIHDIAPGHSRSSSRSIEVSIPLRKPRICWSGRTGMSSTRS
jgi:hypothetical protein